MRLLNLLLNTLVDGWLGRFATESAWPVLVAASLLGAVVLLLLFWFASDPVALRRRRDQFLARALELHLFRHDLRVSGTAMGRILVANLFYLGVLGRPLLVSVIPCLLLFIQFSGWLESRPLRVGETAVLELELKPVFPVREAAWDLSASENLRIETAGVRIPARQEICYRLKAVAEGPGWVSVEHAGHVFRKEVPVGRRMGRVSPERPGRRIWQQLVSPVEPPLPLGSPWSRMTVHFPQHELLIGTTEIDWILACVVLMMLFGWGLGKVFGVPLA